MPLHKYAPLTRKEPGGGLPKVIVLYRIEQDDEEALLGLGWFDLRAPMRYFILGFTKAQQHFMSRASHLLKK